MAGDSSLRLIFETHATSLDNEAGLASGWFDAGLSTTGEHQAQMLGGPLTRNCASNSSISMCRALPSPRLS